MDTEKKKHIWDFSEIAKNNFRWILILIGFLTLLYLDDRYVGVDRFNAEKAKSDSLESALIELKLIYKLEKQALETDLGTTKRRLQTYIEEHKELKKDQATNHNQLENRVIVNETIIKYKVLKD